MANNLEYINRYQSENIRSYRLKLNHKTEQSLIDWLESQNNVSGYIKSLIIKDMEEMNNMKRYIVTETSVKVCVNDLRDEFRGWETKCHTSGEVTALIDYIRAGVDETTVATFETVDEARQYCERNADEEPYTMNLSSRFSATTMTALWIYEQEPIDGGWETTETVAGYTASYTVDADD